MERPGERKGGLEWLEDPNPACADVVRRLQRGEELRSRDFLRPIFKWMKNSSKHYDEEKAFSFLEWMVQLQEQGDEAIGVSSLPHLQPKYGYNAIVTMSQRNDALKTAQLAYNIMISRGDEIDVFTYTSLIDVSGRNGHFDDALKLYHEMRKSKNQPNDVTFITLIRVLGTWSQRHLGENSSQSDVDRAKDTILKLLEEAEALVKTESVFASNAEGQLEVSVYNAALASFVKLSDFVYFTKVLHMMHAQEVSPNSITLDILCKFYHKYLDGSDRFDSVVAYGEHLVEISCISKATSEKLESNLLDYLSRKRGGSHASSMTGHAVAKETPTYTGCLGPEAPLSMRDSVMTHDMQKLLERLHSPTASSLHESDFVTLLHQCRKRKWSDQVVAILTCMRDVSSIGIPERSVSPQPHLAPSLLAYGTALAGCFTSKDTRLAWEIFQEALGDSNAWENVPLAVDCSQPHEDMTTNAFHFFYFVVKGFLSCSAEVEAFQAFRIMQEKGVGTTFAFLKCMLRGFGGNVQLGVEILKTALTELSSSEAFLVSYEMTSVEGFTNPKVSEHVHEEDLLERGNRELLLTLLESVAILGHPEAVEEVVESCTEHECAEVQRVMRGLQSRENIFPFAMILLMAACSTNSFSEAFGYLSRWQRNGFLPPLLVLNSLVLEALAGSIDGTAQKKVCDGMNSLPFRGFLRVGAVKKLHANMAMPSLRQIVSNAFGKISDFHQDAHDLIRDFFLKLATLDVDSMLVDGDSQGDILLNFYATKLCQSFAIESKSNENFQSYLLLYVHHLFSRLLMIRSKPLQLKFHEDVKASLSRMDQAAFSQVLSKLGLAMFKLSIAGNFQSKLVSAFLRCSPRQYLLLSLQRLFTELIDMSEKEDVEEVFKSSETSVPSFPNFDFVKEVFKHISSMDLPHTELCALRRLMGRSLFLFLRHSLASSLKVIQVVHHQQLYDDMELSTLETLLVNNALSDSDPSASLSTYIKNFPSRRDVCVRLCRRLVECGRDAIAVSLLCRFQVKDTPEFRSLLRPSEELFEAPCDDTGGLSRDFMIDFETRVEVIDGYPVLDLGEKDFVLLVNDSNTLSQAEESLSRLLAEDEGGAVVAIDCEWRPLKLSKESSHPGLLPKCSLLQLACSFGTFLFDLMQLERDWNPESPQEVTMKYSKLLQALFSSPKVLKLGFHLEGDLQRLRDSFPNSTHFQVVNGKMEMSQLRPKSSKNERVSLSDLCRSVLDLSMDKRMQCSDWQRRPLHDRQVKYAALDAIVLLRIWHRLEEKLS